MVKKLTKKFFKFKEFKNLIDNLSILWQWCYIRFNFETEDWEYWHFSVAVINWYIRASFFCEWCDVMNSIFSEFDYYLHNKASGAWIRDTMNLINKLLTIKLN